MECQQIEELLSDYIENTLSETDHQQVKDHLDHCSACVELKEKMEEMMMILPDLQEEIPFFMKNRLYHIPERLEMKYLPPNPFFRWVAAALIFFAVCLNVFYFTNIYPPARKALHSMVDNIEYVIVNTEAVVEKLKGAKDFFTSTSEITPDIQTDISQNSLKESNYFKGGNHE
jgi:hypothetical protein